jgi:branched-chain amino acid transport system substrate-binding protein
MTKTLLAILLAGAAAVLPARAQEAIRIGEVNSYKAQPAFLEPYRKGMELAVDEINAAGGVNGRKLTLTTAIPATRCAPPRSSCRASACTC